MAYMGFVTTFFTPELSLKRDPSHGPSTQETLPVTLTLREKSGHDGHDHGYDHGYDEHPVHDPQRPRVQGGFLVASVSEHLVFKLLEEVLLAAPAALPSLSRLEPRAKTC